MWGTWRSRRSAAIYGERFINAGIAEQNMVSLAAGLARQGHLPWVYSIAPFVAFRPYEQIRTDVCLHKLPVKLVGNGGGYGYGIMGATHHALEDVGAMRVLPNMRLYVPLTAADVRQVVNLMAQDPLPNYLRLNTAARIPGEVPSFAPWRRLKRGRAAVVVGLGPVLGNLYAMGDDALFDELEIWSVGTFPLEAPPADLLASIDEKRRVVTMEEHYLAGGLGEAVSHLLLTPRCVPAVVHQPSRSWISQRTVRQPALAPGGERSRWATVARTAGAGRSWLTPGPRASPRSSPATWTRQAIPLMYQRLSDVFASLGVDHEIIFVNDGSPDDSASVLEALTAKDDHVLAIEHSRNFGSQNAFRSGMELATGDAVILLDGDLQDPPELIPALYEKWREGNDVVYGRRSRREAPAVMAMAYKAFYRVFRAASYVPVPLDAGDFALMDRRVVDELLALPETDQFLRGLRAWVGFKQTGVDYVRPERAFGRSTHSRLKNLWWAKKAIFSFSFLPIEVLGYFAAAMTALSLAAVIYEIVDSLRHPEISHGISALIVLVVFFGSLTLLAISVLGEYLIRVFEEVKRRPRFIRKALWHGGNAFSSAAEMEKLVQRRTAARALKPSEPDGR